MTITDTNYDHNSKSHALGSNVKRNSIFNTPFLFVGMGPKGLLDSDSIKSPTSPLDFKFLSNLGNPFKTPKSSSPNEGQQQRSWDCTKVGLSIIDSLKECCKFSGEILLSSECKKTGLSPQMIIKTPNCKSYMDSVQSSKSLPEDYFKLPYAQNGSIFHKGESTVLFEIGETPLEHEPFGKAMSCSLDSCSPIKELSNLTGSNFDSENFAMNQVSSPPHFIGGSQNQNNNFEPIELNSNPLSLSSSNELIKSLSASEIELSEDYTCVINHGPNPKTTHIFCDCVLETHANDFKKHHKNEVKEEGLSSLVANTPNQYLSGDFLSFCYHCNKKLEEGKDIYIYRGDKSFCSLTCRAMEIMIDEEYREIESII
ncbi:FCS-Like Zinc finger 10-like [Gastrolobium bilobum]|uniref:FCS-Like Zinc finger 10-like n=1 Tax=Gastrolobium bilobum TaxID=150636 RepID=UPI002AB31691|nr:FCS-Like Zinc finger 10-like [Gastrolobium bilobum]XP_061347753.1 FCS-Like Zinc finger 10-like [Gastrolobium bilobum]XP_061347754.1 FCS-Like Zinc finger 10-like [Gastrolobium bilobum]XP_061347755.1 FCS-Like Zinc finger 10-like [Gastrolobium bilobum]